MLCRPVFALSASSLHSVLRGVGVSYPLQHISFLTVSRLQSVLLVMTVVSSPVKIDISITSKNAWYITTLERTINAALFDESCSLRIGLKISTTQLTPCIGKTSRGLDRLNPSKLTWLSINLKNLMNCCQFSIWNGIQGACIRYKHLVNAE